MRHPRVTALLLIPAALAVFALLQRPSESSTRQTIAIGQGAAALIVDASAHRAMAVGGDGGSIGVVDLRTGQLLRPVRMTSDASYAPPGMVAVDVRAARVFALDARGYRLHVFDVHSGVLLRTAPVGPAPQALTVDVHTGRVFVVNSASYADGKVRISVLDAASGRLLRRVPVGDTPNAITLDTNGRRVLVYDRRSAPGAVGSVYVLDAVTGRPLGTITIGRRGTHASAPEAQVGDERAGWAYVVRGGGVSILDMRVAALVRTVPGQLLAMDRRRGRLFLVGPDRAIRVIDAYNGRVIHRGAVLSAVGGAIVDERTGAVVVAAGRSVQVLDGRTGLIRRAVALGHTVYLSDVDERSDLALLLTPAMFDNGVGAITQPGQLTILDLRTGAVRRTIDVGVAPIAAVMDGQTDYAIVLSHGGPLRAPDSWAWLPAWLRSRLPFLPRPRRQFHTVAARLSILDVTR